MRCILIGSLALLTMGDVAAAQAAPADGQLAQILVTEIRQLRVDLQSAAATIQRVQIAMYRLQTQAGVLDRVTQRLDQTRIKCTQTEEQRKMLTSQIEQTEAALRDEQNPAERKAAEQMIVNLKSVAAALTGQAQQCQVDLVDVDNQFHLEQAKMNQLEEQLDKLDQQLAEHASR